MATKPLALITGASSGIGETFARKLAARGYHLVLVARRRERLEALAEELHGEALAADLTDDAQLAAVEERLRTDPDLELLVNNAGFGTLGRFFEAPLDGQLQMHKLHVMATMRLTHAALPGMVARRRGAVISVSSVAGFARSPGNVSYCSTKAWINAFTECLDLELKAAGLPVQVQALCPGYTYSEFHDTAGMDRKKIPARWWLSADRVVEESLAGLDRGKLFVIPALGYRVLARAMAFIPHAVVRAGSIRYSRRIGRG